MPCLLPLLPCTPAAQLNASCYKKECIMLTIGTSAHLLGVNFGEAAAAYLCAA